MYQFPPFAFPPYFTRMKIIRLPPNWVAPFGNLRVTEWLASHRSVSSPPPSFIASQSQGILHALLLYLKVSKILEICRKDLCSLLAFSHLLLTCSKFKQIKFSFTLSKNDGNKFPNFSRASKWWARLESN